MAQHFEVGTVVKSTFTQALNDTQGTGFDTRDRNQQDVDDDIDIDGEDDMIYGAAQFTEGDIVVVADVGAGSSRSRSSDDEMAAHDDGGGEGEGKTLQDLVAEGKQVAEQDATGLDGSVGADEVVEHARKSGSALALVSALESRIRILVSSPAFITSFVSLTIYAGSEPNSVVLFTLALSNLH